MLDSKVVERIYLPSIWVAGGYSLWPLDGDETLIRQNAEVEADQSLQSVTHEQGWQSEKGGFIGFLGGSLDKTYSSGYINTSEGLHSPGTEQLQNPIFRVPSLGS